MEDNTAQLIEEENRAKYSGGIYDAKNISHLPSDNPKNGAEKSLVLRLGLVRKYATGTTVMDLCCGNGEHLLGFREDFNDCLGVDFSDAFVDEADTRRQQAGADNVRYICANARDMPLDNVSIGTAYCFSSLYCMPQIVEVLSEVSRVLETGGVFIFDLGNIRSLNSIVCGAYTELAESCHISIDDMCLSIEKVGFEIVEHRRFQLFPLWGDRPWWLKPLLHPLIEKIMRKEFKGKMLDEWISSAPILRSFAFRHVFVCRKMKIEKLGVK
ncbi:class I SAM-dependent methyltransferase [Kiloniella majae]|uniref:class I SAM-dependent methyltransferase n=1 Tax=Kiloniella majae TaxID=1938558 RepID=UPI000A27760E|nr:class I SAM-dependent methyltransferase [Kiloniella majae]